MVKNPPRPNGRSIHNQNVLAQYGGAVVVDQHKNKERVCDSRGINEQRAKGTEASDGRHFELEKLVLFLVLEPTLDGSEKERARLAQRQFEHETGMIHSPIRLVHTWTHKQGVREDSLWRSWESDLELLDFRFELPVCLIRNRVSFDCLPLSQYGTELLGALILLCLQMLSCLVQLNAPGLLDTKGL